MKRIRPIGAWLTVNRQCNFRCQWCYAEGSGYNSADQMSLSLAQKITGLLSEIGVQKLLIIGGEPTLWKPLISFNKFCKNLKLETILVTNAMRFGIDNFWCSYSEYPNDTVGVSIKAGNYKQLLEAAKVKSFDVVKKGISRVVENFKTGVSITYNSFYTENLIEIVKLATECGSKSVKIDFCSTTFIDGKPSSEYMVEPHLLVKNIVRDYPEMDRITNGNLMFEMNVPLCIWPDDFIAMLEKKDQIMTVCQLLKRDGIIFDTDGRVMMCNGLFDFPIGQYGKEFNDPSSFINFLNRRKTVNYYDRMRCYPSNECADCELYPKCGGGCPLRWAVYKPTEIINPKA